MDPVKSPAVRVSKRMTDTTPIIAAEHLHKTYRMGRVRVPVLRGLSRSRSNAGEWVADPRRVRIREVHACSTSSGGLDRPDKPQDKGAGGTAARISFDDREVGRMSRAELDRYRARDVGFVFQFYHLLPELRVLENVTVGAMVRHGRFGFMANRSQINDRARELLDAFGLGPRLRHRPGELSGGERQRVAIARALINRPRLLLADEPTGNLDRKTGDAILDAIADLKDRLGLTIVMVTHDAHVAERADRVVRLADGTLANEP
jgi:lipoprotein-releasing system ATP-binding protein